MERNRRTPETGGKVHGVREMKTRLRRQIMGASAEAIGIHETPACHPKFGAKKAYMFPKRLHREIARVHRVAQAAG